MCLNRRGGAVLQTHLLIINSLSDCKHCIQGVRMCGLCPSLSNILPFAMPKFLWHIFFKLIKKKKILSFLNSFSVNWLKPLGLTILREQNEMTSSGNSKAVYRTALVKLGLLNIVALRFIKIVPLLWMPFFDTIECFTDSFQKWLYSFIFILDSTLL